MSMTWFHIAGRSVGLRDSEYLLIMKNSDFFG